MLIIFGGGFAYFGLGTAIKSRMPNASSNFYNNIPVRPPSPLRWQPTERSAARVTARALAPQNKDFWWHIGDLIKDGLL
jgi:hypothetical protein